MVVALYILLIYVAHAFHGIHDRIVLQLYHGWFARLAIVFSALFLLYCRIRNKSCGRYLSPRYLIGFGVIFLLFPLFTSAFTSFKLTIPMIHAFHWDVAFMRLDFLLHFGHHPWRLFQRLLDYPSIIRTIDLLYAAWIPILFIFCLWMAWTSRRQLRLQFLLSALLVWILPGSLFATLLSSAGPCFYSHVVSAIDNPYALLMQKLAEISKTDYLWAVFNQAGLWETYRSGTWGLFTGISAMPSIHLAMAALFACLAFEVRRWFGWVCVAYAAILQIGSIILGWHYAVDGYAGLILACAIWLTVKRYVPKPDKETESTLLPHQ
jgi:membrane-associated phospholipid phosphatase